MLQILRHVSTSVQLCSHRELSKKLQTLTARAYFCSSCAFSNYNFEWKETKFHGAHTELKHSREDDVDADIFSSQLKEDLQVLRREGKHAAFLKVPIHLGTLVSCAARHGFSFHHSKQDYSLLSLWLQDDVPSKIPHYATHQVGVSGVVLDEENGMAVVVQDRKKIAMWKFPGGFSEPGEDLATTAEREVEEETGIRAEHQSLLVFRQQHNVRFGQSDLYFICRMKPLSFDITMCPDEIAKCEWMSLVDIMGNAEATPLTKMVARMLLHGMRDGYDAIDITADEMQSWIDPKQTFKLYSRSFNGR